MFNWAKKQFTNWKGLNSARLHVPPLPPCSRCGAPESQTPGCYRCITARKTNSPEEREANLIAFDQKVAAADVAAINILATLRFASPKLQEEFRSTLSQLLAKDFKEANSGKWTGDVALGMAIGMFLRQD